MNTAKDIATIFEEIAPLDSGILGDQLGFIYGDPSTEVKGIACLWNVHSESLRSCAEHDLNMIICHEGIWHPSQKSPWYEGPTEDRIYANLKRRKLLEKHGMVVYRSHSNWDALAQDGVHDQAVSSLGIEGLTVVSKQKFFAVVELPESMTVDGLKQRVQQGLGFASCRLYGDGDKLIRRCVTEFERIGRDYDCTQTTDDGRLLWLNGDGRVEVMFFFLDEPRKIQPFLDVYRKIEEIDCPLTFLIHPQIGRQETFDAYRLSRKSYAEHSWELGLKGLAESRPLPPQIRQDLWDLFRIEADEPTRSISRAEGNYWTWALSTSWDETLASCSASP